MPTLILVKGSPLCLRSAYKTNIEYEKRQPININMAFKVLVLSGGGLKGLISLQVLKNLENLTGSKIGSYFDLIVGTSTGAISGAALSIGASVEEIEQLYLKNGRKIFERQYSIFNLYNRLTKPYYDKSRILNPLSEIVLKYSNGIMSDCKTRFIATAVNILNNENIEMSSFNQYKNDSIVSCVERSFSAVLYFGKSVDNVRKIIYEDGGQGIGNVPILSAYINAIELADEDEDIHIYSIGTGHNEQNPKFNEALSQNNWESLWETYLGEGELLARIQSRLEIVKFFSRLASDRLKFIHFDAKISKDSNQMDQPKYMEYYQTIGKSIPVKIL